MITVNVIIRFLWSDILCAKVITLSSLHCIFNFHLYIQPERDLVSDLCNVFKWTNEYEAFAVAKLKRLTFTCDSSKKTSMAVVPWRIPLDPAINRSRPAFEYGSLFMSLHACSKRSAAFSIASKDFGMSPFSLES